MLVFLWLLGCIWSAGGFRSFARRGPWQLPRRSSSMVNKPDADADRSLADPSGSPRAQDNPFAFDAAFVDELSKTLDLSEAGKVCIETKRLSPALLSNTDSNELGKIIPFEDALKIKAWYVVRAREAEENAQRVAREAEKEAQRVARESKLSRAKTVSIFSTTKRQFFSRTFLGQSDLQLFLNARRSSGLIAAECEDSEETPQELSNPRPFEYQELSHVDQLVNGTRYYFDDLPLSDVAKLREELAAADKAKADYNTAMLLKNHFGGAEFKFLANCVNLTDPQTQNPLGDIDSLFFSSSHNGGSIVALVERKSSLSSNRTSMGELLNQVHKTNVAFKLCANHKDPKLMVYFDTNTNFSESDIISVVYCKAGPSEAFQHLQREGIFVVKDGVELIAPTTTTPFHPEAAGISTT